MNFFLEHRSLVMGALAALISSFAYPIYIVEFTGGWTKTHWLTAWMWPMFNLQGGTHPRLVTWILWLMLTGTTVLIQVRDGYYFPAILCAMYFFGNLSLLVSSLACGTWKIKWYDVICFGLGILALVLYIREGDEKIATTLVITADLIAGIATFTSVIDHPENESKIAWWIFFIGGSINIFSFAHPLNPANWAYVETAYTFYIMVCTGYMVYMTTFRRKAR